MKINSRIKLIAISVSMIISLGAVAAPQPAQSAASKQEQGQYTVREGETLAQIAARFRPADASLKQTVQVLVKANPKVFKNGNINLIYPGDVLIIPASLGQSGQGAAVVSPAAKPSDFAASGAQKAEQKPAEQKLDKSAAATNAKAVSQPKQGGVSDIKSASAVKTVEPKQEAPVGTGKSSSSAQVTMPATNSPASSAAAKTATVPAAEQTASETKEEEGGSSLLWIMLGAIGLLAVFAFNKMKGKEPETVAADTDSFDSVKTPATTTKTVAGAAATAAAAVAAKTVRQDEDSAFFNDVEDDIQSAKQPVEIPAGEVDIDLNALDSQEGIVSSAVTIDEETEQRRDADWDKIESTDSVYEDAPEATPVAAEPVADEAIRVEVVEDAGKEDLSEPLAFDMPVGAVGKEEPETVEFVSEEPQAAEELIAETEEAAVETVEYVAEPVAAEEVEETVVEEPLAFAKPEVSQPAEGPATTEQEEDLAFETSALPEDADEDVAVSAEEDAAEEDFSNTHITEADDDTVIEWDSVELGGDNEDIGFVSESVGMTAPLEAKYELAQMYIEIGDPEAARETLNELVEESSGEILAKSKALLVELG